MGALIINFAILVEFGILLLIYKYAVKMHYTFTENCITIFPALVHIYKEMIMTMLLDILHNILY